MDDLKKFPRPSLAVDTALLTVDNGELSVLLVSAPNGPRLPGTFLHEGETLADAVRRSLREKANVTGLAPRQLQVFDDPKRDDRGWVVSVAHLAVVSIDRLADSTGHLASVSQLPQLPFDHDLVVLSAVESLRFDYNRSPDPSALLQAPFTLRELHLLHEAVLGRDIQRDGFRRAMEPQLVDTGDSARGTVGKPARLFTRRLGALS